PVYSHHPILPTIPMYTTYSILFISMLLILFFFFFNDTATTEIYTLSLHDALPISGHRGCPAEHCGKEARDTGANRARVATRPEAVRSEEHTSELQSRGHLVCRLLLEKKKRTNQVEN